MRDRNSIEKPKRAVSPPQADVAPGVLLSVELSDDEEVEWQWSFGPRGQSRITGYQIIKRPAAKGPAPDGAEVRTYIWGAPAKLDAACDATIKVGLESPQDVRLDAYIHTRLARRGSRWVLPELRAATEELRHRLEETNWEPDSSLADARWLLDAPPPDTAAKRWPGAAHDTLTRQLGVAYDASMQDWPLEVADGAQLEEVMAFVDRVDDPAARFDAMALALYCYCERTREGTARSAVDWFDSRLRAGIEQYGHLIVYWSMLHKPVLSADESFPISAQLRRIFWQAVVEVPTAELDHTAAV